MYEGFLADILLFRLNEQLKNTQFTVKTKCEFPSMRLHI